VAGLLTAETGRPRFGCVFLNLFRLESLRFWDGEILLVDTAAVSIWPT
jgi:hypothetical protein